MCSILNMIVGRVFHNSIGAVLWIQAPGGRGHNLLGHLCNCVQMSRSSLIREYLYLDHEYLGECSAIPKILASGLNTHGWSTGQNPGHHC